MGRILIGGDTSGSIDNETLSTFLGFMQQLCDEVNPSGVEVVWWDAAVAGVDVFEADNLKNLASAVRPAGGGGTDPSCVPSWLKKHPKKEEFVCAVMFTDGEFYKPDVGDWGDLPTLWMVVNNLKPPEIPVGKTIYVKDLE